MNLKESIDFKDICKDCKHKKKYHYQSNCTCNDCSDVYLDCEKCNCDFFYPMSNLDYMEKRYDESK